MTQDRAPRVLISDKLSPTAVQIFKDRGIDVTFEPELGKDKNRLFEAIGDFDGLAIRSATKVTEKIIKNAHNLKVIGRAGIGVDNIDIAALLPLLPLAVGASTSSRAAIQFLRHATQTIIQQERQKLSSVFNRPAHNHHITSKH